MDDADVLGTLKRLEETHRDAAGVLYRRTLRASVWQRMDSGRQMRFHQGTPADEP